MSTMFFGASDILTLIDTRFLTPGFSLIEAPLTAIGASAVRIATLRQMRVRHNTPLIDTTAVTYTLRINSVATALSVVLGCDNVSGSNLVDDVDVFPGDLIEVVAIKGSAILSGVLNVVVTIEEL